MCLGLWGWEDALIHEFHEFIIIDPINFNFWDARVSRGTSRSQCKQQTANLFAIQQFPSCVARAFSGISSLRGVLQSQNLYLHTTAMVCAFCPEECYERVGRIVVGDVGEDGKVEAISCTTRIFWGLIKSVIELCDMNNLLLFLPLCSLAHTAQIVRLCRRSLSSMSSISDF